MDCQTISRKLDELLDGELSADQSRALRQHLAKCPDCSRAYDDLEVLKAVVSRSAGRLRAPEDVVQSVRAGVGRDRRVPAFLAAAAALIAVGLAIALSLNSASPTPVHAQVVERFIWEFEHIGDKGTGTPLQGPLEEQLEALARDIDESGLLLDEIPVVCEANYCGVVHRMTLTLEDGREVRAIRVDFLPTGASGADEVVSLFMLPTIDQLADESMPGDHYCVCVDGLENTVYCVTTEKCLFHFVTKIRKAIFQERHEPRIQPLRR